MYIIGITGGTGAGKTSALHAAKNTCALTLDCDAIYHELLTNNIDMKSELKARFHDIVTNDEIDRNKLGTIVLTDPAALLELNEISHKYVLAKVDEQIKEWEAQGGEVAIIDAVALIESGQGKKCDVTVGITAPMETRISRIIKRDGITREQAEKRLKAQQPEAFYINNCDHILENIYNSTEEFEKKCNELFNGLIRGRKL